ncbi:MAG TPA: sulfatase [Bryobacteraceae bacterium]|nr:sulfatase [Bryobacteraceae bacterium]
MRRPALILLAVFCVGCGKAPQPDSHPKTAEIFHPYRFDDQIEQAAVSAPSGSSSVQAADPIVWRNFRSEKDITWILLRGNMGYRRGDLILQGDDSTPVILAPRKPAIAWDLYQAVQIRMLAEDGQTIKIKIGDQEFQQKIHSLKQYNTYRFDIHIEAGASVKPLAIMPTDSLTGLVAIQSIELIPRKTEFSNATGRSMIGKREEYRNVIFVHSPSSLAYEVQVPSNGRLRFGIGVAGGEPVSFRVRADASELFLKTFANPDIWEDEEVDLAAYAGRRAKLTFETSSASNGAVGLWANPILSAAAPRQQQNVLIYMIDTLRADHASLYGYARDTTPNLKKLGAQGLVFEDCQVQATWTKPSVASLMTSLYSFTHGIRTDDDVIPQRSATLAEQLRAAGYDTASMISNPLAGRLTGLQRGFDYLSEWQAVARLVNEKEDRATDSAALNRMLFPWLEKHRDEPFFLYAHATDPHAPYRAPAAEEAKFANPAETPQFDRDFNKVENMAVQRGGFGVNRVLCEKAGIHPDRFIQQARDRYDAKILHNDASFQQLLEKLRQLGILENTLIIVVSDHGEEFWEHGWTGHGQSVYQELAHGVLMMWNPKLIPTPRRIADPVQLIDVMPTVLDLLGIKIPDVVEGQSLAPFVKGVPFQQRTPVMTSRFAHPYSKTNDEFTPENHIDSMALIDANWKLIYRENGKSVGLNKVELYDRRTDREERTNVAAQHPDEVDRGVSRIGAWMDAQRQMHQALGRGGKAPLDKETLDRLRSLGYLGGKQ